MSTSLLVITPQSSFGDLIRESLEETNAYHVKVVSSAHDAFSLLKENNYSTALLDMDLENESILEIGLGLRVINENIHLVLMSRGGVISPAFEQLRPWTLLSKPFYPPDMLSMLDAMTSDNPANLDVKTLVFDEDEVNAEAVTSLPWLQDVSIAAQHLTRITLESSAQAALIVREEDLWAYAGELSQAATKEIVSTVSEKKKSGDLLRFIRLKATQAEHMLYATQLADNIMLAMVFDAETPFSTIRGQATNLAESLSMSKPVVQEPVFDEIVDKVVDAVPAQSHFIQEEESDELEDIDLPLITDILSNVPQPNPNSREAGQPISAAERRNEPIINASRRVRPVEPLFVAEPRPSVPVNRDMLFSRESSPAIPIRDLFVSDPIVNNIVDERIQFATDTEPEKFVVEEPDIAVTRVSKSVLRPETPIRRPRPDELAATQESPAQRRPDTPVRRPAPGELDETRPHSITEVTGRVLLEPSTSGMYDLTYACLLVPRFSTHHLTGDIAASLSEWLPQICIAYAWRLEYISVRPEYLQWVVNVPPSTSPGYLMRVMRQQTSERIFENFSRQKRENPSGDFWAPGYLIMGGTQPHPSKLVNDYIQRTRERQGMI
mgnify:CR=1 FL=1